MPREQIGSCGSGHGWQLQVGLTFLQSVFEEPEGCELDILYTDYEFGDGRIGAYAEIGLLAEESIGGMPQFAARLHDVLFEFSQAVDWSKLTPEALADKFGYQTGETGLLKVPDDEPEDNNE